jgi:alpha-acetolactate decarboxylase
MSYKDVFYFVAMCLTISQEKKNKQIIEARLKQNDIDWEFVVEVSTGHYVFPAMYCALKREGFLTYLPQELLNFMEHVADTNRDRNTQIISQAKELNTFLLSHNITPIFIKGTANLLAGLYNDITERMVGDIDFLFSSQDYPKAIQVLKEWGYCKTVEKNEFFSPWSKHYPRLVKEDKIAAIEIHNVLLVEEYRDVFSYDFIKKNIQIINGVSLLSFSDKLNVSILAYQINDDGFYYKTISLRNAYDVFLLSKKTSAKNAVSTLSKLMHPANCFLATCYDVFNKIDSLEYHKNKKTSAYLNIFKSQFTNPKATRIRHYIIKKYLGLKIFVTLIYKCIFYKQYRIWLFHYLKDIKTLKRKYIKI